MKGSVFVGLSATYVQSQLTDIFFDIAIVLIAVLLVCFEVVMVVVMIYVSGPLEASESILMRQVKGDFTVHDHPHSQGTIGLFAKRLNHDSKALQARFHSLFGHLEQPASTNVEVEDKTSIHARLKKIGRTLSFTKSFGRQKRRYCGMPEFRCLSSLLQKNSRSHLCPCLSVIL